jgi:hypothetical protein
MDATAPIPAELQSFIASRDKRLSKDRSWSQARLAETFAVLLDRGVVSLDGKVPFGSYIDPSWKVFMAWREVVKKARQFGYSIAEQDIKYATDNGGWDEREYRLVVTTPQKRREPK